MQPPLVPQEDHAASRMPSVQESVLEQAQTRRDKGRRDIGKMMPSYERFMRQHVVNLRTHCWEWIGVIASAGYGVMMVNAQLITAHRYSYEISKGPIPDGEEIDHLCRNRPCANPDHLEAVTHRENQRRGNGAAGLNARKTHCKRGHLFDEANTYRNRDGNRACQTCKRNEKRERRARQR